MAASEVSLPKRRCTHPSSLVGRLRFGLQGVPCSKASTYRERLPLKRLQDEVADHPSIIHVHARPTGVEDSGHSHFHTFLEQREEE
ncbi:hypothetical protein P7K49_029514, partial [Saguinus oedipus]